MSKAVIEADVPGWREAGRWIRRKGLEVRRSLAKGPEAHKANTALNWREFWQGRTQLASFPRHIQVGTNWTCNLKCTFCRLTQESTQEFLRPKPKEEKEISPRVYQTLLDILPYAETFQLTPLGEPFLWSRFKEFLELYAELGSGNMAMTTNGLLLDSERAELVARARVKLIFVSIDSSDPDTYAKMRVGGKLDKVVAGLQRLHEAKKALGVSEPHTIMASTFMRSNIEHLPDMVEFAKRNHFEEISVQLMDVENPKHEPEFLGNHVEITTKMVQQAIDIGRKLDIRVKVHLALRNLLTAEGADLGPSEDIQNLSTRGLHLVQKCHYPWYYMLVDTDGDVRPCCWADASWGNFNNDSFQAVWNGEKAQLMRRNFLDNVIPKSCQGKHCRVDM